jgi:hypothetical protein
MDLKLERQFRLSIYIDGRYKDWIEDVINNIEKETLRVFDAQKSGIFKNISFYSEIDRFLEEKAEVEIKIPEYLPLACQSIRFFYEDSDKELEAEKEKYPNIPASYWSNIRETILSQRGSSSLSPSAFIGRIVLYDDIMDVLPLTKKESENPFKYLIAHELIHAFNVMRFMVPAFMDWDSFYKNVLESGCDHWGAKQVLSRLDNVLDSYGTESELNELKKYWPSNAEKWFNAAKDIKRNQ